MKISDPKGIVGNQADPSSYTNSHGSLTISQDLSFNSGLQQTKPNS